ncbi:DUF2497 domain-containing protein [Rhizobium sp. BK251]|uniref:PopZ family protein n=1 Tax=Rhizobium sp. BK251 TaxID=2512125 RepID=UPI00104AD982|nr:DUF2497 domain-containing protein [Rhizobium sp. BK251]TCL67269.1 hypothetical protein EV286_110173 [Rhizobium sp. BK251]
MAQPNVAREPSMEEILASIRRIIESNEPGAGKAASPAISPVYAVDEGDDDIRLTVDDDYADTEFDGAGIPQDPRFIAANSPGPVRAQEAPAATLSLADVAARVRAASERNAAQFSQREPVQREVPAVIAAQIAEPRPVEVPRLTPVAQSVLAVAVPPVQQVAAVAVAEVAQEREISQPMMVAEPPMLPVTDETFALDVAPEAQQPLLSVAAGEQVARSFGELVAAIDGTERRSLDEIAQEMLRPMLQDWLDDNLPTLVERLVREEIERVARGPRR